MLYRLRSTYYWTKDMEGSIEGVPIFQPAAREGGSWREFLAERPLAVVATVGADGTPHATPVEVVVDGDEVYCWTQRTYRKARNVARAGRAALVAYKGHSFVLVRGPAELLDASHADYRRITRMFLDKYERDETYGNDVLIRISAERVSSART